MTFIKWLKIKHDCGLVERLFEQDILEIPTAISRTREYGHSIYIYTVRVILYTVV